MLPQGCCSADTPSAGYADEQPLLRGYPAEGKRVYKGRFCNLLWDRK